ncbi:MAG: phosphopantetheine-binding protein [Candidatus Omnitrophica bacterium]|nr:phosphopantetheine-binding protein [Candidatus Omnitrophota bacterium]
MSLEEKVKAVFKDVLEIGPEEIKPDEKMDICLGLDSTEMVEITVALKRAFNLDIPNNGFKKTLTFNELVESIKAMGVE